ncbi:unnamed protein product [Peniophora sp. CBMAI 1063]|nr:unnamed protein product [Peniophora sp. CBMAI 1063]
MANSTPTTISAPVHLNSTGCVIKYTEGKGRGVFASRAIPAHTLIEVSPVLLFTAEEYEAHAKHTVLDHYTFKWRDGRMALALGLGSLFNHNRTPNVSFSLDPTTESIEYTTTREIHPDEELYIFYGHKLWFEDVNAAQTSPLASDEVDDPLGGLGVVSDSDASDDEDGVDPTAHVAEDDLPFTRVRITPDELEEEDMESIRTVEAWAVDIADPKYTTTMLKWLKTSGYDSPALSHLKRIRKSPTHSTLLITHSPDAPSLPADLPISAAYLIKVPRTAAITQTSLALKNTLWPTVFAPRRKDVPEVWSKAKVRWARRAMKHVVAEARKASASGELPIAAHVPTPFDGDEGADPSLPSFTSTDTRTSAIHPLRHAVMAVIRQVGDYRATALPSRSVSRPEPSPSSSRAETPSTTEKNGQHYLLTSLTLFTTHEPCIMCSMALLHSRVKEVFYLFPMDKTGGCGGTACLPKLDGVNHRFGIGRWKDTALEDGIEVEEGCDA